MGLRTLVLDSNVVLDWLLFEVPALCGLSQQVLQDQLRIWRCDYTTEELTRVLSYPILKLSEQRQASILACYLRRTTQATLPLGLDPQSPPLPPGFPQCRDPDDQPFLALCFHTRADALVTHDKALLKLRKRARKHGVTIIEAKELATLTSHWPA